jgi:hypothetical protein
VQEHPVVFRSRGQAQALDTQASCRL